MCFIKTRVTQCEGRPHDVGSLNSENINLEPSKILTVPVKNVCRTNGKRVI